MKRLKRFDRNLISALLLLFLFSFCFWVISFRVDAIATASSWRVLEHESIQLSGNIQNRFQENQKMLKTTADLLSRYDSLSSREARDFVDTFPAQHAFTAIGVLLPANELLLSSDAPEELCDTLDFQKDAEQAPFLSDRCSLSSGEHYFYQTYPVCQAGEITGVLYGFTNVRKLNASSLSVNQSAQIVLFDGATGDVFTDSRMDGPTNLNMTDLTNLTVRQGHDFDTMRKDFTLGRAGYCVVRSTITGDNFYASYRPVGLNQWMVLFAVPEEILLKGAFRIRNTLIALNILQFILFMIYLIWLSVNAKKESRKKQLMLDRTMDVLDVQQTLFEAHKDPMRITASLNKLTGLMQAREAFCLTVDEEQITNFANYPELGTFKTLRTGASADILQLLPDVCRQLQQGQKILFYAKDRTSALTAADRAVLESYGVFSLMLVPVMDSANRLSGILGCINIRQRWSDTQLMESVAHSFLMAMDNAKSYQMIERMGTIDILTGLKNRNCYQQALLRYAQRIGCSLGCVYVDANGLHELNNRLGHVSGDRMLAAIGQALRSAFGDSDAYRIGGDEFVVFCPDHTKKQIQKKLAQFHQELNACGYYAASGYSWQESFSDINLLTLQAEQAMYHAKHQYYRKKGNLIRSRKMNQKLEKMLLEKQDADTFLSIISSCFMGVYISNRLTDRTRIIYKPSYFDSILEQVDYRFLVAMKLYVHQFVLPEYQDRFFLFLDYEARHQDLLRGQIPEYHYQKTDGIKIIVRVYPASDYNENSEDMFWLFEEYKDQE